MTAESVLFRLGVFKAAFLRPLKSCLGVVVEGSSGASNSIIGGPGEGSMTSVCRGEECQSIAVSG
jgi:hypothetical protein